MSAVIPEKDQNSAADTVPRIAQFELDSVLLKPWLQWQCQMVSGVIRAAIYNVDQVQLSAARAIWPATGPAEAQLVAAATQALKQQKACCFSKIAYGPSSKRLCDMVACPVHRRGQLIAVVVFSLSVRSPSQQQAVIQLIGWGGVWLDTLNALPSQGASKRHEFITALNRSVAQQDSLLAAAIETVNKLARSTACERVSIGLSHNLRVRVTAISNTQRFDANSESVRKIEAAMDECADQQCPVQSGPKKMDNGVIKHGETGSEQKGLLNKAQRELGPGPTLSVPLLSTNANKSLGVIVFEHRSGQSFDQNTVALLLAAAETLSITLAHKQAIDTPISRQIALKLAMFSALLLGPRCLVAKTLTLLLVALCVLSAYISTEYSISAESKVQGSIQQAVVASSDSFIEAAYVRAGDTVEKGQLMAQLDTRSFVLKQKKLAAEIDNLTQDYNDALANNHKSKIAITRAKLKQLEAENMLLDNEQARALIRAPFDGVVTSGDLSQAVGSPVALGQRLFQVSPLLNYRVSIEIKERDIAKLKIGQQGYLVAEAFPDQQFELRVDGINPLADSNKNGSFYTVKATLDETSKQLLPGMQGYAKIRTGEQTLLWIWTHRLVQSLRLSAWKLGL